TGFRRYSFMIIFECSIQSVQASFETFSKMRLPSSPFHGMRSSPGISRPNLMHFTIRPLCPAGCGEGTAVLVSEHFSSAMECLLRELHAPQDTASTGEILVDVHESRSVAAHCEMGSCATNVVW